MLIEELKFFGHAQQMSGVRDLLRERVESLAQQLYTAQRRKDIYRLQGQLVELRDLLALIDDPERYLPTYRPSRRS